MCCTTSGNAEDMKLGLFSPPPSMPPAGDYHICNNGCYDFVVTIVLQQQHAGDNLMLIGH